MPQIGLIGFIFSAIVFLCSFIFVLIYSRNRLHSLDFVVGFVLALVWSCLGAYSAYYHYLNSIWFIGFEFILNLVFFYILIRLLNHWSQKDSALLFDVLIKLAYGLPLLLLALLFYLSSSDTVNSGIIEHDLIVLGLVLLAIIGGVLTELLFRNMPEQRWSLKFICLGFFSIFIFNFYLYTDALLFKTIDSDIWSARGFIVGISGLLLLYGVKRLPLSTTHIRISRPLIFYVSGIFLAGGYLLIMATGGYYLEYFGGDWGRVVRNTFIFVALLLLVALIFSGQIRARLRVFIDKHFLDYKYDYREEWLKIIRQLSSEQDLSNLEEKSLKALADIVDSPSGGLWIKNNVSQYVNTQSLGSSDFQNIVEASGSHLTRFLEQWQWVINLEEVQNEPDLYHGLILPTWLNSADCWLVIPLMLQAKLYGFVVLANPRVSKEFNWEDIDLLRTAGRQVVMYIAHARSAQALIEARQFEAINRLSAYVVHDLKNIMSQLGLLVNNAQKHKSNPEFVNDMIATVENSVSRMERLLGQLRTGVVQKNTVLSVNVYSALLSVVKEKSYGVPVPVLGAEDKDLFIDAEQDRFVSVLGNLVQNAQEATLDNGVVYVGLKKIGNQAVIKIEDNGCGMPLEFIKNRLFRPFDSTKGLTGMGIGVHDAKQFIEQLGGKIDVKSIVDKGTVFTICIPLSDPGYVY